MRRGLCITCLFAFVAADVRAFDQHSIVDEQFDYCQVAFYRFPDTQFIENVARIFKKDYNVRLGVFENSFQFSKSGLFKRKTEQEIFGPGLSAIVIFEQSVRNRKCLSKLPPPPPKSIRFMSSTIETVVAQINEQCRVFRTSEGALNAAGLHRLTIEQNLFEFDGPEMKNVNFKREKRQWKATDRNGDDIAVAKCEVRSAESLSYDEFRHEYLERNRPVIVTGVVDHWAALNKWNRDFFRNEYAIENNIHVKLGLNGVFEGPEWRSQWSDEPLPPFIAEQLEFPQLVMARPGQIDLKMPQILALFQNETRDPDTDQWISAYIEYTKMSAHFEKLKMDVPEIELFKELKLKTQNIWIGDGQTLGKMHFDEFENAMVMIKGSKQFMVYDPRHNHRLYEGHLPEARFRVDEGEGDLAYRLTRSELMESTSLVMSPVDILNPDFALFPNFNEARPMNCTVGPGQMLFLPSFWWHEVQSFPHQSEPVNIAVNFWYEPFFSKEFPCQTCPLRVNPEYFHLL